MFHMHPLNVACYRSIRAAKGQPACQAGLTGQRLGLTCQAGPLACQAGPRPLVVPIRAYSI
jgi:hypothetical protein